MKKLVRGLAILINCTILSTLVVALYIQTSLPDSYSVVAGEEIHLNYPVLGLCHTSNITQPQAYAQVGNTFQMNLKLFKAIQIKTVEVNVVGRKMVQVCGTPFGIKMFTDGLMVVGLSDIPSRGVRINPAKEAGIQVGDIMEKINDIKLTSNEQLGQIVENCQGSALRVQLRRQGHTIMATLQPQKSSGDEKYRAGVWVRDSSAGIGTMTYYDPNSGIFTGLGHAVCDIDTGDIMPLQRGEAVAAQITGCKQGTSGNPGELKGKFSDGLPLGRLLSNTSTGIYGAAASPFIQMGPLMPVAMGHEVQTGKATIITTIGGAKPDSYSIDIEKVVVGDGGEKGQNMVIRITDSRLLEKTGGIVQGMSGSPIIQNGMLVGSVTHVFVNDPTRGFGVFAENIQNNAKNAASYMNDAA